MQVARTCCCKRSELWLPLHNRLMLLWHMSIMARKYLLADKQVLCPLVKLRNEQLDDNHALAAMQNDLMRW